MSDINDGVSIILGRMESNPEEFFESHREDNKWRWIFAENLREVMTEPEKAAIYEGMKKVRRLEITAKAVATVLPESKESEYDPQQIQPAIGKDGKYKYSTQGRYAIPKGQGHI